MRTPVNPFAHALAESRAQIGLWAVLADAEAIDPMACTGFDGLSTDGEHAPNELRTVPGQLQTVAPYARHAIVRPAVGDVALIRQSPDVVAQSLLICMVETGRVRGLAGPDVPHGTRAPRGPTAVLLRMPMREPPHALAPMATGSPH